jgi:ketosteroid isomerase-like protein
VQGWTHRPGGRDLENGMDIHETAKVDDERVDRVRRCFLALAAGDVDAAGSELAEDVEYRVPGRSQLSGTYQGRPAVLARFRALFERTAGDVDAIKWVDWMVGVDHVAVLLRVMMEVDLHRQVGDRLFVVDFDPQGAIRSIDMYLHDEADLSSLFGRA